ncbi:MAG: diguanylate cyclase, partial [Actinomycetota bacterium]|nr:diguanylate cyclase [Actinomycetota bacterium]
MTTGTDSVASFATTVHGVLQHLATTSGFPAWVLMRADERGDQPLAVADPAGVLRPSDPTATRSGSELPRIDVAVMLPTGRTFGRLVGTGDHESAEVATAPATEAANLFASLLGLLIGSDLALAAERRAAEARDGTTDPLTGLATRQGWELRKRLDDRICREYGEPAAVLLIELDELKRNNERYGHSAGDEQLRTAGALVREALAGAHFGARITGDRLGVLIVGADERQVGELERAVRRALSAAQISAVIGVGSRTAGAFASVEAANAEAEAEVERTHSVRHVSMGDSDVNASLLDAMANGAIKAYFQPIVDLRTGEVVAVEALARWQAADSMREPDQFLPALQQAGLLGAL